MSAYDPTRTSRDVRFHATVKGIADPNAPDPSARFMSARHLARSSHAWSKQTFRVFCLFLRKGLSHACGLRAADPVIRLVYLTAHAGDLFLRRRSGDNTTAHGAGERPTAMAHPFARSDAFAKFVFFRPALVPAAIRDFPTVLKRGEHRPLHRVSAQLS